MFLSQYFSICFLRCFWHHLRRKPVSSAILACHLLVMLQGGGQCALFFRECLNCFSLTSADVEFFLPYVLHFFWF
jgi:hypothetical protein